MDVKAKGECFGETIGLLKTRICTDFCKRCPCAKMTWNGYCTYLEQTIWDCLYESADIEQEVNNFTCFFNIERLTLTDGK